MGAVFLVAVSQLCQRWHFLRPRMIRCQSEEVLSGKWRLIWFLRNVIGDQLLFSICLETLLYIVC